MKKILSLSILLLTLFQTNVIAQESYGNTLNLGVGVGGNYGYYRYAGSSIPVLHIDYEFDVAKNFTLAPFLNLHTFSRTQYWGNRNTPYRDYNYRETAFAIGGKGTYYFDEILKAGSKWDFYLAGSLGFVAVLSRWDNGYEGDKDIYRRSNPLYLDLHIGAEYHVNSKLGVFLDLSTGVSTIGIAIH